MKKIFLIPVIAISLFLMACGGKQPQGDQAIKEQIFKYKEQVADLNNKIAELEAQLNPDSVSQAGIKVEVQQVSSGTFEHHIEATGSIEAVKEAFISPEMSGQIKKIYVNEGDHVQQGKTLVALNSEVLRNNLAELEINLELAKTMYEKQKSLWEQEIGTEVQYLQAKTQKESLERSVQTLKSQIAMTTVNAPFSGIVDQIFQKEGELGTPGMRIIQLVDLNYMFAVAEVSEKYISSIHEGDKVKLHFPAFPDMEIESTVFQKGNILNPNNRTFEIKVKFQNKDNKIKPNLLATLTLNDYSSENAITVPNNIVMQDINGAFVFVEVNENGKKIARKKYVKTGLSNNFSTIITSGLSENDKVITKGYHLVKDGTEIFY